MKSNSCLHAFHVAMLGGVKQTSCQQYATEKDWDKCWSQNVTNMAHIYIYIYIFFLFKKYLYIYQSKHCVRQSQESFCATRHWLEDVDMDSICWSFKALHRKMAHPCVYTRKSIKHRQNMRFTPHLAVWSDFVSKSRLYCSCCNSLRNREANCSRRSTIWTWKHQVIFSWFCEGRLPVACPAPSSCDAFVAVIKCVGLRSGSFFGVMGKFWLMVAPLFGEYM